jgi:hypothetical protein
MSSRAWIWPLAACLVAGAAAYLSRGVLDQAITATGPVRVALLPPWQACVAFVGCAAFLLLLIDRVRSTSTRGRAHPLADFARPWLALSVLALPFLPRLADAWPVLQMAAGPAHAVLWLIVGGLTVWTAWQAGAIDAPWWQRQSRTRMMLAIALATGLFSSAAAARLTRTALFPAGDEPHYLVIAQSLWRDGDFKIENQHTRGDYREYYTHDLEPHYLTRGKDGEIYSIHPVGMPILMAPIYGLGGYEAVVFALLLLSSIAAAMAWGWVAGALRSPAAATFGWFAVAGSAPFLFNTFTVYPEVVAAVAVMVGLTTRQPIVAGIACGVLPWLSTKYAPMSLALVLISGPDGLSLQVTRERVRALVVRAIPYGLLLAGWFGFFYLIWGSLRPQAPYGALVQTAPLNLVFGAPGLLFDQEYGLLAYAPAYILAVTGLWQMWRAGGRQRQLAGQIVIVFAALLSTVGAFRIWWGGSAAPARPLASGLLMLAMPIGAAYLAAPIASARRAAQYVLVWAGVAIALTLAFAQNGLLINNDRDGSSALIEWWLPRWETWSLVPSFIHHEAPTALLHCALWLAVAGGAAVALRRVRASKPGAAALGALGVFIAALTAAAALMPLLPADPPQPKVDLRARARLASLDEYDAAALPAAVVYDPMRKVPAPDILPMLSLAAVPFLRHEQQPVRVIHNGRFSLPAGDYAVDVQWAGDGRGRAELGVQIGRIGPPMEIWSVTPEAGATMHGQISLPVDANFVGFTGSTDLERAIARIAIRPVSVVDAGHRPRLPTVLAAARYPGGTVFFHDEQLYPEPLGFWTMGTRTMEVTLDAGAGRLRPFGLRIHSGARPNHVTLISRGWRRSFDLQPATPVDVTLPDAGHRLIPLTIVTRSGFVPSELDPASRDRRFLGAWIELRDSKEPQP